MKTTALIEMGKDGTFGIFTPDINTTIIGDGETIAEAKADFENSVKEIFEAYKEHGDKLPDELIDIEFEYKYDIASFRKNRNRPAFLWDGRSSREASALAVLPA
jgi:predicted RNase H-like HicB family nuclease